MGWLTISWRWMRALRWWQRILGLLLLVALAVGGLRLHGLWRWQRVQADIAAAGLPMTVADLLRDQPPIDRGRQERLWRALQGLGGLEGRPWATAVSRLWSRPAPPLDDGQAFFADAPRFAPLHALLGDGPVTLSQAGWEVLDATRIELLHAGSPRSWEAWRSTPFHPIATAAAWWATQAVRAKDPLPAVDALDQWQRACAHPATLLDAMLALAVAGTRDDAYLWLALHDRLPDGRVAAWGGEPTQERRWLADGYAGERILFNEPQIRHTDGSVSPILDALWATKPHQLACVLRDLAALEAQLQDRAAPPPCPRPPFGPGMWSLVIPNLGEAVFTVIEATLRQRLQRIAGMIADRHRHAALPADAAACAAMLPPGALAAHPPQEPAIRYERLGPSRFRVGCDPTWPATVIPAERLASSPRAISTIGQPASSLAMDDRRYSLEIDLDAILAPPARGTR